MPVSVSYNSKMDENNRRSIITRALRTLEHRRWFILILWLVILVSCAWYLTHAHNPFKIGGITDPQVESSRANKLMTDKLSYGSSDVYVLFQSGKESALDSNYKSEVNHALEGLKKLTVKHHIISPYDNLKQISKDKKTAYAVVVLSQSADETASQMQQIRKALNEPKNLKMWVGGTPPYIADVQKLSQSDLFRAELVAFPILIIALIVVFSSVVSALLPIISGAFTVGITMALLFLIGQRHDFSIFVLNIASMLGLGLSLDYTLLIVNRFREELSKGKNKSEALAITMATAGKTVLFSGLAVLISLSSLMFFPENILYSIGVGGVIVVVLGIINALIFLPALILILGERVNSWSITWRAKKNQSTFSAKKTWLFHMAMKIMKYPFPIFFTTIALLLVLGYPFLKVNINRPDSSVLPVTTESRQFIDKYQVQFDKNELSPVYIVVTAKNKNITDSKNIEALYNFVEKLKKDKRVKRVDSIVSLDSKFKLAQYQALYKEPMSSLPEPQRKYLKNTTKGKYTVITVISKAEDTDKKSYKLIDSIRQSKLSNGLSVMVTGESAVILDTITNVYKQFFKMVIIISVITYIVLLILLRSLFLPIKAILMNFASLFVSYGMLVFIYQEGHFSGLLRFTPLGFTDLNLPILLFCALFGISMDYEIFLLTRIKEFYDQTGDNTLSVALGLERSARIITSAALIMALVAFAFITAEIIFVKAFGMATMLAVLVDATIIRLLLVPSTMRLLGKWNWYLPRWLDRILPKINLERD